MAGLNNLEKRKISCSCQESKNKFHGRPEPGLATTVPSSFSVFLNFGFSYHTLFLYLQLFYLNNICLVLKRLGISVSGPFQFRVNDYPIELLDPSGCAVSGVGLRLLACWYCGSKPPKDMDVCRF
jgi:hypothetical protein